MGLPESYAKVYAENGRLRLYPVEFVVRTFLGTYPHLRMDRDRYGGSRILDLGFGDGRNIGLLADLGFEVHGVEIGETIVQLAAKRLAEVGILAKLQLGTNRSLPFPDAYFDYVLACHSCYYVEEKTRFNDNLNEIHRVLSPKGLFICSLPKPDTYILQDAEVLGDGYYRITNDPYGVRNGTIFRAFATTNEIRDCFAPNFGDFSIGFCDDDFYGLRQKIWIVVCRKKP